METVTFLQIILFALGCGAWIMLLLWYNSYKAARRLREKLTCTWWILASSATAALLFGLCFFLWVDKREAILLTILAFFGGFFGAIMMLGALIEIRRMAVESQE